MCQVPGRFEPDSQHDGYKSALTLLLFVTLPFLFYPSELIDAIDEHGLVLVVGELFFRDLFLSFTVVLFVIVLTVFHEILHARVYEHFGYNWTCGLHPVTIHGFTLPVLRNPYIAVINQPVDRNHDLWALITPLIVITGAGIVLYLAAWSSTAALFAVVAIVWNTSGSAADLFETLRISRYPAEAEFLNAETEDGIEQYRSIPD